MKIKFNYLFFPYDYKKQKAIKSCYLVMKFLYTDGIWFRKFSELEKYDELSLSFSPFSILGTEAHLIELRKKTKFIDSRIHLISFDFCSTEKRQRKKRNFVIKNENNIKNYNHVKFNWIWVCHVLFGKYFFMCF